MMTLLSSAGWHTIAVVGSLPVPHLSCLQQQAAQARSNAQVLDLGCGIGGPAREICRFSGAEVTGVNNNAHQIKRAQQITSRGGAHVARRCTFVQADFMKLPFDDNSQDGAYAVEATCHAPDPAACYKEILRCIKPGGYFVCYEWVRSPCPLCLPIKHAVLCSMAYAILSMHGATEHANGAYKRAQARFMNSTAALLAATKQTSLHAVFDQGVQPGQPRASGLQA